MELGVCRARRLRENEEPADPVEERSMKNLDTVDYFRDESLPGNPHPFFDHLRSKGPVTMLPGYDIVAVTGYDEGVAVFRDDQRFSSVIAPNGPLPPLPFKPQGEDITGQIEEHRHLMPGANTIVTLDPPAHTRMRSLLVGMITPRRLKENEAFMWRLADMQLDTFIDRGQVEVLAEYAQVFTRNAVADLLGVPASDFPKMRRTNVIAPGILGVGGTGRPSNPFESIAGYFADYIKERREQPRQDVMSELANVRYADGSLPPVDDVVMIVTQLFGAGEDTTTRTIAAALRFLAEDPELQRKLRVQRDLIPNLVEETLRLEGTTRSDFRLVKKRVKVGDMELAPGTMVVLFIAAMDRDPRRFESPHALRLDRKNAREHVAFGRGIHACAGAPLARAEVKVTLERFMDRTSEFGIDEQQHGPVGHRRYEYIPNFLLQGLAKLHLRFAKA
jgi:cytochrome P450